MLIMGQACHGVRNNATDTLICSLKSNPGSAQPGTYGNPPTSIPGLLYGLGFLFWFGFVLVCFVFVTVLKGFFAVACCLLEIGPLGPGLERTLVELLLIHEILALSQY